jgi:multidrug transporter EmrE-like cation transporter
LKLTFSATGLTDLPSSPVLEAPLDTRGTARRSFLLVFSCTAIGALAQMLIKAGAGQLGVHVTLIDVVHDPLLVLRFGIGIASNFKLFCGYCLYGVNTFLMALALKGRELSRLYPIIALTYVWVTLLSLFFLSEHMNFFRAAGIVFIVGGVSILGLKQTARNTE